MIYLVKYTRDVTFEGKLSCYMFRFRWVWEGGAGLQPPHTCLLLLLHNTQFLGFQKIEAATETKHHVMQRLSLSLCLCVTSW